MTTPPPRTTNASDGNPIGITLVGAGVVGAAILRAHLRANLSVTIADQDLDAVQSLVNSLGLEDSHWSVSAPIRAACGLPALSIICAQQHHRADRDPILIESIPERLELKRDFFARVQSAVPDRTVLCTNTSSLRISDIASSLAAPQRFCGLHFFMPVVNRDAVEVIRGTATSDRTFHAASQHVLALGKFVLPVCDSPGFIVNRLLAPYLNEALNLLCRGADADQLQVASELYGMPMSPLELVDTIGARTLFDAGRVYWQAFPHRIDPSPLLAGLVKSQHLGKQVGKGLFNYDPGGHRSPQLCDNTHELIDRYRNREAQTLDAQSITHRLAIPMWIEAAASVSDAAVRDVEMFNLAMQGGLGYHSGTVWLDFFDRLGSPAILSAVSRWSGETKAMRLPPAIKASLAERSPTETLRWICVNREAD